MYWYICLYIYISILMYKMEFYPAWDDKAKQCPSSQMLLPRRHCCVLCLHFKNLLGQNGVWKCLNKKFSNLTPRFESCFLLQMFRYLFWSSNKLWKNNRERLAFLCTDLLALQLKRCARAHGKLQAIHRPHRPTKVVTVSWAMAWFLTSASPSKRWRTWQICRQPETLKRRHCGEIRAWVMWKIISSV